MVFQDNPSRVEFSRVLVAADARIDRVLAPGLSLAVKSTHLQGLTVLGRARRAAGPASWLRDMFDPLRQRPRPGEPAGVNRPRVVRLLVLALASSAGVHGALVPAHALETPVLGVMFALSALALAGVALWVDRRPGPIGLAAAVLLLSSLLVAYAATRVVALPPLPHAEPVDALGALTKLVEATGLVLALRLFHTSAGHATALPAQRVGARP